MNYFVHRFMIMWLYLMSVMPRPVILMSSSSDGSSSYSSFSSLWFTKKGFQSTWSSSWTRSSWTWSLSASYTGLCSRDHFTCGDGTCIPIQWECDWYLDCPDNTDEHAHCKYKGGASCSDNKVIPTEWVCDGFPDCVEGEDEEANMCATRTSCKGRLCDQYLKCLEEDEVCNGVFDCQDRTDEDPKVCDNDCFLCDNGAHCISMDWRCDSVSDCNDISDESNKICGPVSTRCWEGTFPCKHNQYCVPQGWRCDGENDCGDLSDELNCDRESSWHVSQGWSQWSSWTECSAECGEGVRQRLRTCSKNNPLKICDGDDRETENCHGLQCIVHLGEKCGHKHSDFTEVTRVVGGKKAVHGDWPWQAQLIWLQGGSKYAACGGTLIHPKIVLGAAHCFIGHMNDATRWLVHMGKHGINTDNLSEYEVEIRISSIEIHPKFNTHTLQNDIAILVLDSPVVNRPEKHIRWACLDQGIDINEDTNCFISGWGLTEMGGKQAWHLQDAPMPILDRDICNAPDYYNGLVRDTMFCAGYIEGGVDACQGDSGGPLSCQDSDDGLWYVVGITSWGHGCALPKRPGIYTKVASFTDWILQVVHRYDVE